MNLLFTSHKHQFFSVDNEKNGYSVLLVYDIFSATKKLRIPSRRLLILKNTRSSYDPITKVLTEIARHATVLVVNMYV